MFLNTIERKTRCKILSIDKIFRNTQLKGSYALFKLVRDHNKMIYPMLSLKETEQKQVVIETFFIKIKICI